MRRKIAGTVGSVLLCVLLLAGCSDGASTADSTAVNSVSQSSQQETVDTTATSEAISKEEQERKAALEESERKFKSAENYQEGGEYFKAYSLYQKVIEDDSNYTEAQKRAAEMLDLYWKQQDSLVEQGEYQTAIENTLDVMSFLNMTSPLDNDMGLERTILQVAEKLAKNCGFTNPKAEIDADATDWYSKIYSIEIECDGINGKTLDSMSKTKIVQAHENLSEKFNEVIYRASFGTFCRFLLGDIHNNGKWYSVNNSSLAIETDAERENQDEESASSASSGSEKTGWTTGGPGVGKVPSKSSNSTSNGSVPSTTAGSSSKDSYGHTKGDAFAIAEKAVKGKLKSPSTAKFCSVTEATIGCSGNTWVVRGWVDAQNGFGATVRTQFAVTFTFASKDMYSLDSCIVT